MRYPEMLPAFSQREFLKADALLDSRVTTIGNRPFIKSDWVYIYCSAKNIPEGDGNDLNIDVVHKQLGVEHRMLCVKSCKSIKEYCGTTLMHHSAPQSIRIPSIEGKPTKIARDVLRQYAELIQQRRQKVAENAPDAAPDMRVGWLLWQESLNEFLYFEEEMLPPSPADYWAEWKESGGGLRKASRNLWVYEKKTDRKRYLITISAGAKIQPYFDVPGPKHPNLYYFRVQGEELKGGWVRIWITSTTAILLKAVLGSLDKDILSSAIIDMAKEVCKLQEAGIGGEKHFDVAESILITVAAYTALTEAFAGMSDEHRVQLFVRQALSQQDK